MTIKKCGQCEFAFHNNTSHKIVTKRGMTQPLTTYCQHPEIKMKRLGVRALDSYGYPVWCPLLEDSCTCLYCGVSIRLEEGDTCRKHHRNL